ncbi:MAG: insulinase family protein [Vicinamibacterales bacterium]
MTSRARKFLIAAAAAVAMAFGMVPLQQTATLSAQAAPALTQALPVDPDVTTGQFDNGLKYMIRRNALPAGRAELRLVVNVGSLVEDNDQLGLAHFVEHMAFNGTRNFPKLETVAFLESIGMRFGPSINASTSFDETIYMLQVPTEKPEVLDRSMLILEDWAHNVSFDPAEIDKERGVIIEEWRLRRGAGARMQDQQFPTLLKGSRYAERLPIGTVEHLQTFKHPSLTRFYKDWYRPDLMTVIAVGDFDVAAMKQLVTKHFGALPKATNPRPLPAYAVPPQPGTLYTVATDAEAPMTQVSVYGKMALRDQSTVGAYRRQLVEGLFAGMLNARFNEMSQKPDAPFMAAGAGRGLFVKNAEASMLNAMVKDGGVEKGLTALYAEAERVVKFGFTQSEFDRQKAGLLRGMEQALTEKDKRPSAQLAAEYVRAVTQGEPIPGLAYEAQITRAMVPTITLTEVNGLAAEWVPEGNRVVMVSAPKKEGVPVPTEAQLAAAISAASTAPMTAYVDTVTSTTLITTPPTPGTITREATRAFGITEWTLSNGIKVVLKPTDFKADEILFRAFSPGGSSLAKDADFLSADAASTLVSLGGVGKLSNIELGKTMAGKVASVSASISELEEGLSGRAAKKDLEAMFQLTWLRVMEPRADPVLFGVMMGQMKSMMANQMTSPEFAFSEMVTRTMTQDHPRARTPTPEQLATLNLDTAMGFYKERFADMGDFTFVFVGSLDPAQLRPLVEKYLASLPSTGRKETWRDIGVREPETVVEREVKKGIEPKSQTAIMFTGPMQYNQEQRVAIRAMADILQTRLRETLREELGGTYSVSAGASYENKPRETYQVSVGFGSDPSRTAALGKRVFEEIEAFKSRGPTEKQVSDVKAAMLRDFENNIKQNAYVLSQTALKYQNGEAPETLLKVPSYYENLSVEKIKAAANTYLNTKRYVKVVLLPEK